MASVFIGWSSVAEAADKLIDMLISTYGRSHLCKTIKLYGVPRGGGHALDALIKQYGKKDWPNPPFTLEAMESPYEADAIIDDLIDSGETRDKYAVLFPDKLFFALYDKRKMECKGRWVVFPWETERNENEDEGPTDAIRRILQYIGEDPDREGLKDTPVRVLRAWAEMTSGYDIDVDEILTRTFSVDDPISVAIKYDQVIISRNIRFTSVCEHHMLPFVGKAHVAYLPKDRVVGLSKLSRAVEAYARRLQIQERMTSQIADAIYRSLDPLGVVVVVRAKHMCMGCRGVMQPESDMVTSAVLGVFREQADARAEVLKLIGTG